jgi:hypothetical protein
MPRIVVKAPKPLSVDQLVAVIVGNTMRRKDDTTPFSEALPFVEVTTFTLKDLITTLDKMDVDEASDFVGKLQEAFDIWGKEWLPELYSDLEVPLLKEPGDDEEEPFPEPKLKEEIPPELDFETP